MGRFQGFSEFDENFLGSAVGEPYNLGGLRLERSYLFDSVVFSCNELNKLLLLLHGRSPFVMFPFSHREKLRVSLDTIVARSKFGMGLSFKRLGHRVGHR